MPIDAQDRVVLGLDAHLAGDRLLEQDQERGEDDEREDPERHRLHPDRALDPRRSGSRGW